MADEGGFSARLAIMGTLIGLVSGGIAAGGTLLAIPREDRKVDISETGADRDYLLKVTDKALSLATSGDLKQRCLVSYLVATLPDHYGEYRAGLLDALDASDESGGTSFCVQKALDRIAERQTAEIKAVRTPAGTPAPPAAVVAPTSTAIASTTALISTGRGRYAVDVFWCDGDAEAPKRQGVATTIADRLKTLADFGRIRVRPLPAEVNAQPGYGIHANVVRFEKVEADVGARLATSATAAAGVTFTGNQIQYRTPDYVSVFVCGAV